MPCRSALVFFAVIADKITEYTEYTEKVVVVMLKLIEAISS